MAENLIKSTSFHSFDPSRVPSPCFVVDEYAIEQNLKILQQVQLRSGAKILLALKAFSMFSLAPLISRYLSGTCASGLHEARLGKEEFAGEVHTYSAAYTQRDLDALLGLSDHLVFNSLSQWQCFSDLAMQAKQVRSQLQFGLRVNPLHSEGATPAYDPCSPGSRLGVPIDLLHQYIEENACANDDGSGLQGKLAGLTGLHFHTLCEQGYEPLSRTLDVIETHLGGVLPQLEWLNLGGGHHITDPNYDLDALISRLLELKHKYNLQIYLEPGEAIAINAGVLVSEVLDLSHNGCDIAIVDSSATCHMPDTIEMPYQASIFGGEFANVDLDGKRELILRDVDDETSANMHHYRIGGQTCLAGDVMGDYRFAQTLQIGQRLMFDDMAHYTMVKTTTFNGIALPSIAIWNSKTDELRLVKCFTYEDFKSRLS